GRGAHRVGDAWSSHGCEICPPHGGSQASGSPNVYVNGSALARIGDSIDCGSSNMSGSKNVIVN
ncbi:MAG: PAAR domain-containing protein, partial [Candidatus Thioglobus sp.]